MTAAQTTQTRRVGSDVQDVERPDRAIAGALFSIAGIGIVMSIITGEALYPRRYTTFANTISDLSGTEPPHSIMLEPSRTIFIVTMLLAGALVLVGAWFLARAPIAGGSSWR